MPPAAPAAVAALVSAQPLFYLLRAFAVPQPDFAAPPQLPRHVRESLRTSLLLAEVASNFGVVALTWKGYRFCDPLARAAIGVAIAAAFFAALSETLALVASIAIRNRSDYHRYSEGSFLLHLMCVLLPSPFIVAAARAWLRKRVMCSSLRADAIAVLVFGGCCIVTALVLSCASFMLGFLESARNGPVTLKDIFVVTTHFAMTVLIPPIVCGLGLWANIDSSRDVLIDGLVVIVPPTLTMIFSATLNSLN